MKKILAFAKTPLTVARAVIRHRGFDLLFKAIIDGNGTSCGVVYCSPARNFPDAENIEPFYDELFAASAASTNHPSPVPNRIVIVSSGLGPGGSERQIANTLVGLRRQGKDIHYLGLWLDAVPGNDFYLDRVRECGVPAQQLVHRNSVARKGVMLLPDEIADLLEHMSEYALSVILNLVAEFRRLRPSVVHTWLDETNIYGGIAAILAGVPKIVLSCRSVAPVRFPFYRDFMKPAYRALAKNHAVLILNNSAAGARSYAEWLGIDRSNFSMIANGLDLDGMRPSADADIAVFRREIGIPDDAPVVGSIFRIGPEKRPTLWLDTARWVLDRKPDCHFIVLGDGPLRQSMQDHAAEIDIADRVHLLGVRSDVKIALSAMDAFLLTSEIEGLPNVVIEAQAMGVPVVAQRVGGMAEAVDENGSALLSDDGSPDSLGALLLAMLDDAAFLDAAKRIGPAFTARRFNMTGMLENTIAAYKLDPAPRKDGL